MSSNKPVSALAEVSRGYAHLDYAKLSSKPSSRYQELRRVLECWNQAMDIGLETVPAIMKTVEANLYFAISLELHRKQKKTSQAILDYSRVLSLEPQFMKAYIERGKAWLDVSDQSNQAPKSALKDFTQAVELGCKKVEVFEMRGQCYEQIGQFRLAAIDFSKAIDLEPKRHFNYYHRANAFRQGKQYLAAQKDYRTILALSSNQKLVNLAAVRLQDIANLLDKRSPGTNANTNKNKNRPGIWSWFKTARNK